MIKGCFLFLAVVVQVSLGGEETRSLMGFLEQATEAVLKQATETIVSLPMANGDVTHALEDILYLNLRTSEVTTSDVDKFELYDLNYDEATGTISIQLIFPSVLIKGNYVINGTILQLVPIYGGAGFRVQSKDLILTLNGTLPLGESSPQIKNEKITLYDQAYTASFTSLLGGGIVLSMVTGKVTPLLGKLVFDSYKNDLQTHLHEFFITAYNKELVNYHTA